MGKIAFVFSGQGAQYTGMGKELFDNSPAAKKIFDIADSVRPSTSTQCFEGDKETLSRTCNTQPCVMTVDLAAAEAVEIDRFEDAVQLLIGRGSALQFECECDVCADGEFFEHIVLLKDKSNVGIAVAVESLLVKILGGDTLDDDLAGIVLIETAKQIEHGRFAAAGFAQQEHHAFLREAQGDVVNCGDRYAFFRSVCFT